MQQRNHPRDRLLPPPSEGTLPGTAHDRGITPGRIIVAAEGKALIEGCRKGNLTDPVRVMFEALTRQEDAFFALGGRVKVLKERMVTGS